MRGGALKFVSARLLVAQCSLSGAISIVGYDPTVNDRFANDSSFLLTSSDSAFLSGVGIADTGQSSFTGDDGGRWVTMISSNVFLSAQHFSPMNGSSVKFYETNDLAGGQVTRTVQSSQRIGSSDIRIGVLDTPLPETYRSFNFVTEDIFTVGDFVSSNIFEEAGILFGRSPTAYSDLSQEMSLGSNILDRWGESVSAAGTTDVALAAALNSPTDPDTGEPDPNFVFSEAFLQTGDSGGPLMVIAGGELTIVGINWFISNAVGNELSGFSYVGNYDVEIQEYIDANAVPEVAAASFLTGLSVVLSYGFRRRRRA